MVVKTSNEGLSEAGIVLPLVTHQLGMSSFHSMDTRYNFKYLHMNAVRCGEDEEESHAKCVHFCISKK